MKKWGIFALCAVLGTGLLNGVRMQVLAQEETETAEAALQSEESSTVQELETPVEESLEEESEIPELPSSIPMEEGDTEAAEEGGNESQDADGENFDIVSAMETAYSSLDAQIDYISTLLDMEDSYDLVEGEDNFYEALAVYAIRHGMIENYPYEVEITSENDFDELQSIYWSLNTVSGAKTEEGSTIYVLQYSSEDVFSLSGMEQDTFEILMYEENREKVSALFQN